MKQHTITAQKIIEDAILGCGKHTRGWFIIIEDPYHSFFGEVSQLEALSIEIPHEDGHIVFLHFDREEQYQEMRDKLGAIPISFISYGEPTLEEESERIQHEMKQMTEMNRRLREKGITVDPNRAYNEDGEDW